MEELENLQLLIFENVSGLTRLELPARFLNLRLLNIAVHNEDSPFEFDCLVEVVQKCPFLSNLNVYVEDESVPLNIVYKIVSIVVLRNQYVVLSRVEQRNSVNISSDSNFENRTLVVHKFGKLLGNIDPTFRLDLTPTPPNLFEGVEYYVQKYLPDTRTITYQGEMFKVRMENEKDYRKQNSKFLCESSLDNFVLV